MRKIGILFTVACLLFVLLYFLNTNSYVSKDQNEKRNSDYLKYIEEIYKINANEFNINSLMYFNDSLYLSINKRLLGNEFQLVLYIPANNCQDCVIRAIEKLKSLPALIQDKIFIMTSFSRERDIRMWISSHKYKYPVYNSINFRATVFASKNRLTLFLEHSSGIPSNFFILEKIFPYISENYFNYIISIFEKGINGIGDERELLGDEKPEIQVLKKHDFSELTLKEKVFTYFEFENLSSLPFIITDVRTNCGCTMPEWDRKPVGKNGILRVKVEFVAENTGIFSKRITVFSNAKDSPHTLTIAGNVKKPTDNLTICIPKYKQL